VYLYLFIYILFCFGVATLHLTTLNRTTVKRQQFVRQQLTGTTVNRSDKQWGATSTSDTSSGEWAFFIAVVPEPYSASFNRTSLGSITVNRHSCGNGTNNKGKPLFIEILNASKSATIALEIHHLFYFYIILFFNLF